MSVKNVPDSLSGQQTSSTNLDDFFELLMMEVLNLYEPRKALRFNLYYVRLDSKKTTKKK